MAGWLHETNVCFSDTNFQWAEKSCIHFGQARDYSTTLFDCAREKGGKHPFVAAFTNRVNQNTVSQISVLKNQCHVICD